MAFAYYEDEVKITCPLQAACQKTIAIFEHLGWKHHGIDVDQIVAYTSFSIYGWGEKIAVFFPTKTRICVSSESIYWFQLFDMGKNRANVEKFLDIFSKATLPLDGSDYAQEKNRSFLDRFFSLE